MPCIENPFGYRPLAALPSELDAGMRLFGACSAASIVISATGSVYDLGITLEFNRHFLLKIPFVMSILERSAKKQHVSMLK